MTYDIDKTKFVTELEAQVLSCFYDASSTEWDIVLHRNPDIFHDIFNDCMSVARIRKDDDESLG